MHVIKLPSGVWLNLGPGFASAAITQTGGLCVTWPHSAAQSRYLAQYFGTDAQCIAAELDRLADRGPIMVDGPREEEDEPNTKIELESYKPLVSCWFCGGQGWLFVHEYGSVPELEPYYQVECEDCGATGPSRDNPSHARKWWNGEMISQAIRDRKQDQDATLATEGDLKCRPEQLLDR